MKKVLLYSGGMDSLMVRHLWEPDTLLYVDYGGRYTSRERADVPPGTWVVELPLGRWERPDTVLPLRNLFFACVAAEQWPADDLEVAFGSVKGDQILDQSAGFAALSSELLSYLWQPQAWTEGRTVKVVQPAGKLSKPELVAHYLAAGGDREKLLGSFSCHQPVGGVDRCGECVACASRWVALTVNGLENEPDCSAYVERVYLPRAVAGEPGYVPAQAVLAALGREVSEGAAYLPYLRQW